MLAPGIVLAEIEGTFGIMKGAAALEETACELGGGGGNGGTISDCADGEETEEL